MLAFPLLTGFFLGGPSVAGLGFAIAATSGFLVNGPITVLKGLRHGRAWDDMRGVARRRAAVLGLLGAGGAALGMTLAPPAARMSALLPAALAAALAPSVLWGKPKTLAAELLMAGAFAVMLLPIAGAGRGDEVHAAIAAGTWLTCFWLATLGVHAIKARARPGRGSPWTVWASPTLSLAAMIAALVAAGSGAPHTLAVLGVLPTALVTLGAAAVRVHPRHLKRVGWSLAAGNVVTLVLLVSQ
jgi:hypothetical protein